MVAIIFITSKPSAVNVGSYLGAVPAIDTFAEESGEYVGNLEKKKLE